MTDRVQAPFMPEQVASLNAYQVSGFFHPFTCGADRCHGIRLIAVEDGWHCASQVCDYRQDWAHSWMADWSWRAAFSARQEAWRLGIEHPLALAKEGPAVVTQDQWLTPSDPEPPAGTIVESEDGYRWWRDATHMGAACNWFTMRELTNPDRHDSESWTKVAGNYGPVRIVFQLRSGWLRCPRCEKPFDELPEGHTYTHEGGQSVGFCFNVPLDQP